MSVGRRITHSTPCDSAQACTRDSASPSRRASACSRSSSEPARVKRLVDETATTRRAPRARSASKYSGTIVIGTMQIHQGTCAADAPDSNSLSRRHSTPASLENASTRQPAAVSAGSRYSPTMLRAPSTPTRRSASLEPLEERPEAKAPPVRAQRVVAEDEAEAQPHRRRHQRHHPAGILVTEELAVEPDHALVLVPLDEHRPRAAAGAAVVRDSRMRHEQRLPAFLLEAHAPVQVFAMQEVAFIPQADLFERLALDQHARARDRLDADRLLGQRLVRQEKIREEPRPQLGERRQPERADEGTARRGQHTAPARLLR